MRILLLLSLASWSLSAQPVSIGVKIGSSFTDVFETAPGNVLLPFYIPNSHRFLVGATFQANFPARFSLEVDGIYRRVGFQQAHVGFFVSLIDSTTTANSWEIPVLGKYALLPGPIRPFVDAGANFRSITGSKKSGVPTVLELTRDLTAGFTFGGGVEIKMGRIRVTPELRYTHWGSENFRDPVNSLLHTNLNQGDFIMGLTF